MVYICFSKLLIFHEHKRKRDKWAKKRIVYRSAHNARSFIRVYMHIQNVYRDISYTQKPQENLFHSHLGPLPS